MLYVYTRFVYRLAVLRRESRYIGEEKKILGIFEFGRCFKNAMHAQFFLFIFSEQTAFAEPRK